MIARSHSFGVQLARVVLCSSTRTAAKLEADYAYESSRSGLHLARNHLSSHSTKSRIPSTPAFPYVRIAMFHATHNYSDS